MPELRCAVQTCAHNKNSLCSLDTIEVGGSNATQSKDTCCDSFREKRTDGYTNCADGGCGCGCASERSQINCKAHDCQYNHGCSCHAGKVNVQGTNAHKSQATQCGTFSSKF